MPILLLIAAGLLAWLWWTKRLAGVTPNDWIALAVAVLGTKFLISGQLPTGGAMVVGAAFWGWRRMRSETKASKETREGQSKAQYRRQLEAACLLLNVNLSDDEETIKIAHRLLISSSHPDKGGDTQLASQLNEARDLLIRHKRERDSQ